MLVTDTKEQYSVKVVLDDREFARHCKKSSGGVAREYLSRAPAEKPDSPATLRVQESWYTPLYYHGMPKHESGVAR